MKTLAKIMLASLFFCHSCTQVKEERMENLAKAAKDKVMNYYRFADFTRNDSVRYLFSDIYLRRGDTQKVFRDIDDFQQTFGRATSFSFARVKIRKSLDNKNKKEVFVLVCKAFRDKDSAVTEDMFFFTIHPKDSLGNIDQITISDWSMNN